MSEQHFYRDGSYPCDEPILYEGAGLEGIYLCNGYDREEVDGEWYTWIEDLEGLHHAIALYLVLHRKSLAPKEFRFIRNTMDKTQADIAQMMRVSEQTVARWEKGATPVPGSADTLLRSKFISEPNIRNKISRGKFTAVFFIQCLEAIGVRSVALSD